MQLKYVTDWTKTEDLTKKGLGEVFTNENLN